MVAPQPSADALRELHELLVSHLPLVRWLARRKYNRRDAIFAAMDVDDIAQDIVLRVLRRLKRFDPERGSFTSWLGMVANDVARCIRTQLIQSGECEAKKLGNASLSANGEEYDRLAGVVDVNADDPGAGGSLVRVLVPVEQLNFGAVSTAWVRDRRTGHRVQVPAADVVVWRDRLFVLADGFDESEDGLFRVRFGNDVLAWVRAAPAS